MLSNRVAEGPVLANRRIGFMSRDCKIITEGLNKWCRAVYSVFMRMFSVYAIQTDRLGGKEMNLVIDNSMLQPLMPSLFLVSTSCTRGTY